MKKVYEQLLEGIPAYHEFLTADELEESSRALAEKYPRCVELFPFGKTRQGSTLNCLKIGEGRHTALMFGCPHPNEPIGTMMLEYFTRELAENEELRKELDYTWYVVKAWDMDGLRLNEKWLKGPYTLYNYSRNFFRPAGHQQVDWTFPVDYKELHFHDTIPESEAMMGLIDKIRPDFIYSLHNAGFGGVYWYLSGKTPEIYEAMRQATVKQGIPMHLGEPEAPFCVEWAPAVYKGMDIKDQYDYMEQYGGADMKGAVKWGNCSAAYASQVCGAFTLLTEEPYFYDKRITDTRETDMLRRDAVLEKVKWNQESNHFIKSTLALSEKYMDPHNPFLLALQAFTEDGSLEAEKKLAQKDPMYQKPATVAEKFDNLLVSKFYRLLSLGMLIRANEWELDKIGKGKENDLSKREALERGAGIGEAAHRELADELEEKINYEVVPIKKLVSIQLECGIIMAEYLKHPGV